MQRRRFLTALLGTLAVALPAGKAAAACSSRHRPWRISYHAGEAVWREMREGDVLNVELARKLVALEKKLRRPVQGGI